jgi:FkbM family methyltransferase
LKYCKAQLVPTEGRITRAARYAFRSYRNCPLPVAHGLLRRFLGALISPRQKITLRSGLKLEVDLKSAVQSTIFWYDGDMEPQLSWAVRELFPVGGTFIDCGANCGYIGLEARLFRHANVVFIEPHAQLADVIQRNIVLNGWEDSCEVIRAAASDSLGIAKFYVCRSYDGSHSLLPDWWRNSAETQAVEVEMITLSDILQSSARFQTVSFLKVDTEGNDFAVLKGLREKLNPAQVRVIYAELTRDRAPACRLLEDRGYAGFGYRPHSCAKELRRDLRRCGNGESVPFFFPLKQLSTCNETLWVAKAGVEANHLHEILEIATAGEYRLSDSLVHKSRQ